jgi:hypothetical protein
MEGYNILLNGYKRRIEAFLTTFEVEYEVINESFYKIKRSDGNVLIKPSSDMIRKPTYIYHSDGRITIEVGLADNNLCIKKFRKLGIIQ